MKTSWMTVEIDTAIHVRPTFAFNMFHQWLTKLVHQLMVLRRVSWHRLDWVGLVQGSGLLWFPAMICLSA
jgi:hypothetical protein